MKRSKKPAVVPQADEPARPEVTRGHIFERPDGFYWRSETAEGENGPFTTLAEAEADMQSGGEMQSADPEALQEAESELGISEWIDPDTGGPAEDNVPRIEDH